MLPAVLMVGAVGCAARTAKAPPPGPAVEPASDLSAQGTRIRIDDESAAASPEREPAQEPGEDSQAPGVPRKESPVEEPAEPPSPAGAPVVRVLDPGAGPRRRLRYEVLAARTEMMTMTMSMTMEMAVNGATLPRKVSVKMRTQAHIDLAPAAPGEVAATYRLLSTQLLASPGQAQDQTEALRSQLAAMVGISGTVRFTTRGYVLAATLDVPPGVAPALTQTLSSIRDSMKELATPLPAEAVGVGATWDIERTVEMNGISLRRVDRYRLQALSESTARIEVTSESTAPRQRMKINGASQAEATLESMRGSSSGHAEWSTGRFVPRSCALVTSLEMLVKTEASEQALTVATKIRTDIEISE